MSPSSGIATIGVRGFGFARGPADFSTGGPPFGKLRFTGESDAVRFNIVPPRPPIHTRLPPRKTTACSNLLVIFGWTDQVEPPSSVSKTVPNSPTAIAAFRAKAWTANRFNFTEDSLSTHVCPPSVVRSVMPPDPTANPARLSKKLTAYRFSRTFVFILSQVSAPSLVLRIVPLSPTATPCLASKNFTSSSQVLVPDSSFFH